MPPMKKFVTYENLVIPAGPVLTKVGSRNPFLYHNFSGFPLAREWQIWSIFNDKYGAFSFLYGFL